MKTATRRLWVLPAAALLAAPASAQDLLWETTSGQVNFTTSESDRGLVGGDVVQDTEVADDFHAFGAVERVVMHGTNCTQCAQPAVTGVFVRFYEWTANGPGALQGEFFVADDDPGFVYDAAMPRLLDVTLGSAFQASGWHFVAGQLVVDGGVGFWRMVEANRDDPTNASVHFRDNLAGGTWMQDAFFGQPEFSDFSFELYGTAVPFIGGLSTPSATRSGRFVMTGSGFGAGPGDSSACRPTIRVIVAGGTFGFGGAGWVRGYATADGALLWEEVLAPEGAGQYVTSLNPVFSDDGGTAYVATQFLGDVNEYGYLLAIATGDPAALPGDVNGDGIVGIADLLALLAAWGPCPQPPDPCNADLDGNGTVGIADLLVLLASWT